MAEEVEDVCGPHGKHDPDRTSFTGMAATRERSRSVAVGSGARGRGCDRRTASSEVPVRTYEHFASRDQLSAVVLERMLAGVSTRRYRRLQEPVGEQVEQTAQVDVEVRGLAGRSSRARAEALLELMSRQLQDVRLGGADDRRDRAEGPHLRGRAGDHDRRSEDPARAVGRLDREQDRHRRAPVQPRAPRPGHRAGRARRDRRLQGAQGGRQRRARHAHARAALHNPQRAQRHSITCPSATATSSGADCAGHGQTPTTTGRSSNSRRSRPNWNAPTLAPRRHSGRAWPRHSRLPASASKASSARRSRPPTPASR